MRHAGNPLLKTFEPAQQLLSAIALVLEYHTNIQRRMRLRQILPPATQPETWAPGLGEAWPTTYGRYISYLTEQDREIPGKFPAILA